VIATIIEDQTGILESEEIAELIVEHLVNIGVLK